MIRVGKFVPPFGLNVPYHTLPTRQGLGFSPGNDKEVLEVTWSGSAWNFAVSAAREPWDSQVLDVNKEKLFTGQVSRAFSDRYRVGLSYLSGASTQSRREALGAHAILGFTKRWAYLTEFTYQRISPLQSENTLGLYHFSQLLYEITKGVNLYFLEEYEKTDLNDTQTLTNSAGPGIRFFPRPHFEVDGVFLKKRIVASADRYDDYAWLVLHYYF